MKKVELFLYTRGISVILAYPVSKLFISLTFLAFFLNGGQLNAEIVFVTMSFSVFIFTSTFNLFSQAMNLVAEILVSLKRIQDFLLLEEKGNNAFEIIEEKANLTKCGIWMNNVTAAWKKGTEPTLNNISLNVMPGELLTVIGPVGSGKTSLLMSMLGEIPVTTGNVSLKGKIAYASQEAWGFNETIRENILFGEEYEEDKYGKVLYITALEKDISLFPKGDLTIVGERGVIMSGGQKARINLARALYRDADIFLLDDPLSAVDVPVAKHIFEKCIMEYLKEKICILVTHQIQFLNSASKILVLNKGTCEYFGNYTEMMNRNILTVILSDQRIIENSMEEETAIFNNEDIIESTQSQICDGIGDRNNIVNENNKIPNEDERLETVGISVYKEYVNAGAGIFMKITILVTLVLSQSIICGSDYWLIKWLTDTRIHSEDIEKLKNVTSDTTIYSNNEETNFYQSEAFNIYVYFGWICAVVLTSLLSGLLLYKFFTTASIKLHRNMLHCITRTPISFLDNNPIARSVVFSHLSVSLYGLTTIRAFKAESKFKSTFNKYQDNHTATWFIYVALSQWLHIYGGLIPAINLITTIIIINFSIEAASDDAGSQIGLVINYGLFTFKYLQHLIGMTSEAEFQFQMNSVTRILNYSKLESEASYESLPDKRPSSDWPQKGEILFDNVSVQYSKDKNIVLKNIAFRIHSGEKIGIVGRTGAGKSSIIASLFRMIEPTGTITIDGIDTKDLGLRDLRSKISIIPQDPMLFTGPLRRNIDPFNEYSDDQLWKAIEEVQLKEVISKLPGRLDTYLTEGGRNFSVGERQLICLARTILRQNKILVMDEATSNIDKSTDSCIQKIIREKFKSYTVLTIAHRLHTIIDSDRIMVMDTGIIREFDSPYSLLKNVNGTFYNLVKNTGITSMNELYRIAKNKYYMKKSIESTKL
ncbi:multidrug resistance-associated protein 4-like [Centruroides sculpturatus]|uniref:multidrug resistance-associated protein 4-like n=1 Tax=Centruroides sculpturatus TaxID=218467 RepID=UPI000C6EA2F8|nr:multidrug resistance-associated protein 4-like [Centruroides sculpturatus]